MKTGIIILSWNSRDMLAACLEGLFRHEPDAIVYIVDNASEDGSPDYISEAYPAVTLIRSIANLGFAAGNNVGIRQALKDGCDAVLLLNNDTIIDEPFLQELTAVAERHSHIGVLGPVIVEAYQPDMIQCSGGRIKLWNVRFDYLDRAKTYVRNPELKQVDYVLGAAMLIKRDVVKQIGLLDEEYFPAYVEEADYCYRAGQSGYGSGVYHGLRIRHIGGQSSGGNEKEFRRMMNHRLLFAQKHLDGLRFATAALAVCSRIWIKKVFGI